MKARARSLGVIGVAALAVALQVACAAVDSAGTGNTNWKLECKAASDCPSGLACACGSCGPTCDGTLVCRSSAGTPVCTDAAPGAPLPGDSCPRFPSAIVAPTAVETTFESVSAVLDAGHVLVDTSGIYWLDGSNSEFALPWGASSATLLGTGPSSAVVVTGLVSDEQNLYWGEAAVPSGPPEAGPPPPPGRLHVVPKSGSGDSVVLDLSNQVVYPLGVDGARVINWFVEGELPGIYAVSAADGSFERLPIEPWVGATPKLADGNVYWVDGDTSTLFRASLSGALEPLVSVESMSFDVGAGFVLWRHAQIVEQPLTQVENFVKYDFASGCVTALPGVGETISSRIAIAGGYVYWQSFNGLQGVSPGDPPLLTPLLRVNLASGALDQIVTPGFQMTLLDQLVGSDSNHVYVLTSAGAVVSIRAP